jgi:hypothetical protein
VSFLQFGPRPASRGGAAGLDAWLVSAVHPDAAPQAAPKDVNWDGARLAADLVYDTAVNGLKTGVRAFIQEGTRRLLFAANEYEVLFRIGPNGAAEGFDIVGQVLHEGLPLGHASVRLTDDGSTYPTDQTGGFKLTCLAAGAHRFEVATEDGVIDISPIAVGAAH